MISKTISVVVVSLLLSGCVLSIGGNWSTKKQWYHKLEERSPNCAQGLQAVSCDAFVADTKRLHDSASEVMRHVNFVTLGQAERHYIQTLVEVTKENLQDVGDCEQYK